ncbi:hypothetical protein FHT39_003777 [Mitsuaria sp. BK045]|uniref:hypothetical protein n=1 Tax=unclassified Roseateles TaxID=2626991 RepID=UPI00160A5117|nr:MULTISPECIES: hypothetical protein [unclassified Roseateles]MBB3295097.1 hypothetical protein [Mitsuaria sp. BK041]MBB3364313.1 hypothetical protein [Mitsuaria sp. BK045]
MLKVTGLDALTKRLNTLADNAKKLDGTHSVALNELLTPAFVAKHTRFANADELFDGSGFDIKTTEDFKAIPDDKWDEYIRSVSSFPDWASMQAEAGKAWVTKQLGL